MLFPTPLFHWSPRERRELILREGLQIYSEPVTHSDPNLSHPWICFGTTPSNAWSLSGDVEWTGEIEVWDLWQHWIGEQDDVRVLATFGDVISEVRINNTIPPDKLWYVGTRDRYLELKVVKPKSKPKAKRKKKDKTK